MYTTYFNLANDISKSQLDMNGLSLR